MTRMLDRYRREMKDARSRVEALDRRLVRTPFGRVEYVDRGDGPPILVVHGITQAADGALEDLAPGIVPPGYRLIAPSRFGYMGTDMPPGATPEMQADAFDALLEQLDIEKVLVVAGSAGTTSALNLAVRHPARVRAMLLVSSNVPGSHQSKGLPPRGVFRAVFSSDPLLWLIVTYFPGLMARLSQVLRLPDGVEATAEDLRMVSSAMHRVFPASMRADGVLFDAYVSNPAINRVDVSSVAAPTLVMHALDDPGPPYAAAVAMVRRMPVAKLLTVEHGGHLMLGDHPEALDTAQRFLRAQSQDLAVREQAAWMGGVNDGSKEPEDLRDGDGDRLVGAVR